MDILAKLERALEKSIEGIFSRAFGGKIQPVEIGKKLAWEMDSRKTVSISQVYAPNRYTVFLSPNDLKSFEPYQGSLIPELEKYLADWAKGRGYHLVGKPEVSFESDENLGPGSFRIGSQIVETPTVESTVVIRLRVTSGPDQGRLLIIDQPVETIGRASDNDLQLLDSGVSRHHAEMRAQEEGYLLVDLGSTNGTLVNGENTQSRKLRPGDVIQMGTTIMEFEAKEK